MSRTLACLILAVLPLAACGAVSQPAPTLRPLEDCPSCGVLPVTVNAAEFWAWSPTDRRPQVWIYGSERLNGNVNEVYVSPAQDSRTLETRAPASQTVQGGAGSGFQFDRPLGCLNSLPTRFNELDVPAAPVLLTTSSRAAASLDSWAAADAACSATFGSTWRALTTAPMLDSAEDLVWQPQGFWVVGHRPLPVGTEW